MYCVISTTTTIILLFFPIISCTYSFLLNFIIDLLRALFPFLVFCLVMAIKIDAINAILQTNEQTQNGIVETANCTYTTRIKRQTAFCSTTYTMSLSQLVSLSLMCFSHSSSLTFFSFLLSHFLTITVLTLSTPLLSLFHHHCSHSLTTTALTLPATLLSLPPSSEHVSSPSPSPSLLSILPCSQHVPSPPHHSLTITALTTSLLSTVTISLPPHSLTITALTTTLFSTLTSSLSSQPHYHWSHSVSIPPITGLTLSPIAGFTLSRHWYHSPLSLASSLVSLYRSSSLTISTQPALFRATTLTNIISSTGSFQRHHSPKDLTMYMYPIYNVNVIYLSAFP